MSENTLCILGVDGADYKLLKQWNCGHLLQDNHGEMNTFSYGMEVPHTLEVWPTIATGLDPSEHGIVVKPGENSSSIMSVLSRIHSKLPDRIQEPTLELFRDQYGKPITTKPTIFDQGAVYNWPGVTPCTQWSDEEKIFKKFSNNEIPSDKLLRDLVGNSGMSVGWLTAQELMQGPIAGTHIHILDFMGHAYANHPSELKRVYEIIDKLVGRLRNQVDRLLIISDHGMQTSFCNDNSPGTHSDRAFISFSGNDKLPSDVHEVSSWINKRISGANNNSIRSHDDIDTPKDHLRDLGYL